MDKYGLIGKHISYSFSAQYFARKFEKAGISASYKNFDCQDEQQVRSVLEDQSIRGYNVTIPYKEQVIPMLDALDPAAEEIGAVNTIKRTKEGKLKGYNTDYIGFRESLLERFKEDLAIKAFNPTDSSKDRDSNFEALILGTGGASKAVVYALAQLGGSCLYVSRKRGYNSLTYDELKVNHVANAKLIVNCTPLGTHPDIEAYPDIPYHGLSERHIVYDLIYNPEKTTFLSKASAQNAQIINGLRMLEIQAEAAWDIWQEE